MALYIDSAFLNDITEVSQTLPLAGVTTNPTLLLNAYERGQRLQPSDLLAELLRIQDGFVFMQPGATSEEEMYEEAQSYIQADPERVVPKIPMTHIGLRVAQRLKIGSSRVAFTAVTTVAQAYSAAIVGADYIILYYNRLERCGIDASVRVSQINRLYEVQQLRTRIVAASIKSSTEVARALLSGVHDLTVPPQTLLEQVSDQLSEEAVEKFSQDWKKMKRL